MGEQAQGDAAQGEQAQGDAAQGGEARTQSKRKRPLEEYNKTLLGLIALVVVAVIVATMLLYKAIAPGSRQYTAQFAQAAALKVGNAVTIAGVPVGQVTNLKLADNHVEARFRVKNNIVLGKDSRASIMTLTILGGRYLSLSPAGSDSVPNNIFDMAHTEVPYDLEQALTDATYTFERTNFGNFGDSVSTLAAQMKSVPPLVPQALANIDNLSKVIGERRDQIGTLLKTTESVTNTLRSQQATIGSLVNQGNSLLGKFVERRASFHALLQSLTNLVQTLSGIVVDDRAELEETLSDLEELTGLLSQHDDLVRSFLQTAPVTLRGLTNATGTGNAVDLSVTNGLLIDSWMCAISGRAKQFGMIEYLKDCK